MTLPLENESSFMIDWKLREGAKMVRKSYTPEQIINKLCEAEILLNREIFTTLKEAKVLIEEWRREYNGVRPHSSLGYRPPAPEAILTAATI